MKRVLNSIPDALFQVFSQHIETSRRSALDAINKAADNAVAAMRREVSSLFCAPLNEATKALSKVSAAPAKPKARRHLLSKTDTGKALKSLTEFVGKHGSVTRAQAKKISGLTRFSNFQVRRLFRLLQENGVVKKQGDKRSTRYAAISPKTKSKSNSTVSTALN